MTFCKCYIKDTVKNKTQNVHLVGSIIWFITMDGQHNITFNNLFAKFQAKLLLLSSGWKDQPSVKIGTLCARAGGIWTEPHPVWTDGLLKGCLNERTSGKRNIRRRNVGNTEVVTFQALNVYGGSRGLAAPILNLDTRWKRVVSFTLQFYHGDKE